ncbi:hypothetical protein ACFQU2_30525 [Siccirubricoccus deserti]
MMRDVGLALDWLHEQPRVNWRMFRALERDADGLWDWPARPGCRRPTRRGP